MKYLIFYLLLISLPICLWSNECLFAKSTWQRYSGEQRKKLFANPPYSEMNETCFITFIERLKEYSKKSSTPKKIYAALREYCTANTSFSWRVLHAVISHVGEKEAVDLSDDIITLWKFYNGPIDRVLDRLEKKGRYAEADSLYTGFESLSQLDVYHLIKWANVKGVLSQYGGAARLYCKICAHSPSFISMAQSQFFRLLLEADSPETQRMALKTYTDCYLVERDVDTLALSKWLSRTCNRLDLYELEIDAVVKLDKYGDTKGESLLRIAQRRFRGRLYSKAIRPARLSWKHLTSDRQKQECAIILYQSYINTENTDSAIIWLEKVNLTDLKSKATAVTLYQKAGLYEKADSLVNTILESVCRDTLVIRQYLYRGNIVKASGYSSTRPKNSRHWVSAMADNFFWKLRTAVYAGNLNDAGSYLDSINRIHYRPSWPYAGEILAYKMAMQRLVAYPAAFKYWGRLQYAIYLGKPGMLIQEFKADSWPQDISEYVAVSLVDALIEDEAFDTAQMVLDLIAKESKNPQIFFLWGYIHFMLGNIEKAKKLFENIILMYPEDVFAHKARIYLLKLKKS